MSPWFYIAIAEYIIIAIIIDRAMPRPLPRDAGERTGEIIAICLWPVIAAYFVGYILWLVSLKLVSKLLSAKR